MAAARTVYLVRHGEAAASWETAVDPGLSVAGQQQAQALLDTFGAAPPRRLVSSPLQRAQETAAPLAAHWGAPVHIEDGVRELPSAGVPLATRREWLTGVMRSRWPEVDEPLHQWRERAWQSLLACTEDTVFFTHFMVINALVGRAMGDDRLVVYEPDYCAVTELRLSEDRCTVVALGKARTTLVL